MSEVHLVPIIAAVGVYANDYTEANYLSEVHLAPIIAAGSVISANKTTLT